MRFYNEKEMLERFQALTEGGENVFLSYSYSLEHFAQDMNTNRTYASRFLNEVMGCGFIELRNRQRLDHVQKLHEEDPQLRTGELAKMCGFHSAKQMRELFLQHYGYPFGKEGKNKIDNEDDLREAI